MTCKAHPDGLLFPVPILPIKGWNGLKLRIALAQTNHAVGDIEGNEAKILRWIDKARRAGADLVAFPELAVSGYPAEDLLLKPRFLADCRASIERIAGKVSHPAAIVGFPSTDGGVHNSAAVLAGGELVTVTSKIHLPNYGVFDEKRYFSPGKAASVLRVGDVRVGLSICEDIWRDDVSKAQVVSGRAQVIVNVSSSPYHAGKGMEREDLMKRRAVENGVYVAYVNLVGGQDELVFDGHSVVVDPAGSVLARARQFREDLIVVDIDPSKAAARSRSRRKWRGRIAVEEITVGIKRSHRWKKIVPRISRPLKPAKEIYTAIVTGTKDYVTKNGFKKVIIGLSGGIDSSLVAAIAVDALGKDSVVGVTMPSRYSSPGSVRDARRLADNLGIEFLRINIEPVHSAYLKSLGRIFSGMRHDTAEENIQARIRGNILMALSNKFGWLVLTTGNKSELAVGYCTLYGDLAGGFAILKDVPKTLVYELARYRNSVGTPVIPDAVMTKPPSAELRPDQKDVDSLPPYEILDPVLAKYVIEDMAVDEIADLGFDETLVRRVARLVDGNEYKRRQGPPGVRITPRAFGKDRRMPITNLYR
jgi:NAD+ synthase (glutamine-hydrolysing)